MKYLQWLSSLYWQLANLKVRFTPSLFEQGANLSAIQTLLEPNSSKTTERYTQVSTQKTGTIVPLRQRDKKNIRHKGEHIQ